MSGQRGLSDCMKCGVNDSCFIRHRSLPTTIGTSHLPDRKKSRFIPSPGKAMPTLSYDRRGPLQIDRLPIGITVNADPCGITWSFEGEQ